MIELPENLVERYRQQFGMTDSSEETQRPPYLKDVRLSKHAKNFVIFKAVGEDAEQARELLEDVLHKLLAEHSSRQQDALRSARARLALLETQIRRAQAELLALRQGSTNVEQAAHTAERIMLALEISRVNEQLLMLERQRSETQAEIADAELWKTRIVREPSVPKRPTGLTQTLYVLLGAFVGLMVGVLGLLTVELFDRQKRSIED